MQNIDIETSHTADFGAIGHTVWQIICYVGTKLPVSHCVHIFANAQIDVFTSKTVEKIDSCKGKCRNVLLIYKSQVDAAQLTGGVHSYCYCYYYFII